MAITFDQNMTERFGHFTVSRDQALRAGLALSKFVFWRLNSFEVIGWENLPMDRSGVIIAAEHWSMIDSWMLGTLYLRDGRLEDTYITPWHLPDRKNFMEGDSRATKALNLVKAIPIDRSATGRRADVAAFYQCEEVISQANLNVFVPGGRQRPGQDYQGKKALGRLALQARKVVPVAFDGMLDVKPYQATFKDPSGTYFGLLGDRFDWRFGFRVGQRIKVVVGKPLLVGDLAVVAQTASDINPDQAVADHIVNSIKALRRQHLAVW